MTRWLPSGMPLSQIDAEISSFERLPQRDRTVADTDRLADLRNARRRIAGVGSGCHGGR